MLTYLNKILLFFNFFTKINIKNYFKNVYNADLSIDLIRNQEYINLVKTPLFTKRHTYSGLYLYSHPYRVYRSQLNTYNQSMIISNGKSIELSQVKAPYVIAFFNLDNVTYYSNVSQPLIDISLGSIFLHPFSLLKKINSLKTVSKKNAYVLLGPAPYNPFHFLTEQAAPLIKHLSLIPSGSKIILADWWHIREIIKILDLNYVFEFISANTLLELYNCTVLSSLPERIYLDKELLFIRDSFANKIGKLYSYKVIFCSRFDFERDRRKLINENECLDIFKSVFTEIYYFQPGKFSVEDQFRHFYNAEIFVGQFGANLITNILWAKNLKIIIELVPYDHFGETETEVLAEMRGAKYFKVNTYSTEPGFMIYHNQKCDINELQSLLNSFKS